jgi:hypothetical protein
MQHAAGPAGGASGLAGQGIDENVPQSARVYDYLLGGKDNYAVDRSVGEALIEQVPTLPVMVRAQRAFLARAVRYLVTEGGMRQFLDIGTGVPSANNVHEVAQEMAPDARVMYVDNDPIVLAHARALMKGNPAGQTGFIQADLRQPEKILNDATLAEILDLTQPMGLMLVGILHHLRESDNPYEIVAALVDWLPTGSYLSIASPSADFDAEAMAALAASAEQSGIPYVPRSRRDTERFFAQLDLVEPGLVPILAWRPDPDTSTDVNSVFGWAGVARKP